MVDPLRLQPYVGPRACGKLPSVLGAMGLSPHPVPDPA